MSNFPWPPGSKPIHLGDGLYAWNDDYMIWLAAERANGWRYVALEPGVMSSFTAWVENITAETKP